MQESPGKAGSHKLKNPLIRIGFLVVLATLAGLVWFSLRLSSQRAANPATIQPGMDTITYTATASPVIRRHKSMTPVLSPTPTGGTLTPMPNQTGTPDSIFPPVNTPGASPTRGIGVPTANIKTPTIQRIVYPSSTAYRFPTSTPYRYITYPPYRSPTLNMTLYVGWTRTAVARITSTSYGYQTSTARVQMTATANAVGTAGVKTMTALPGTQTALAATITAMTTFLPTYTATPSPTTTITATPTATLTPGPIAFSSGFSAPFTMYSMNPDGLNVQLMQGDGLVCDWAPGRMSLVIERGSPSKLYTIDRDGSGATQISGQPSGKNNSQAAYSPDGTWIVFASGNPGNRQLHLLKPADPASLTELTMPGDNYSADWLPASLGNQIVFVSTVDGNPDLFTLDLGASLPASPPYSPVKIPGNSTNEEDTPHFSPDGSMIAFSRYDGSKWEVCAASAADISSPICTTSSNLYTVRPEPAWSADGSRMIFISDGIGVANIWSVNADGSGLTVITYSSDPLQRPNWAP